LFFVVVNVGVGVGAVRFWRERGDGGKYWFFSDEDVEVG